MINGFNGFLSGKWKKIESKEELLNCFGNGWLLVVRCCWKAEMFGFRSNFKESCNIMQTKSKAEGNNVWSLLKVSRGKKRGCTTPNKCRVRRANDCSKFADDSGLQRTMNFHLNPTRVIWQLSIVLEKIKGPVLTKICL